MSAPEPPESPRGQPAHGGDLVTASAIYGVPAGGWVDLSTGINPIPYPFEAPPVAVSARLPGRELEQTLINAARDYYGAGGELVAGAGTQAFIQSLPRLRVAARVGVRGPTYSEHARAWSRTGHEVSEVQRFDDLADFDVAVVVNPNNPDGKRTEPQRILGLAARMAQKGGLVIVDEAFCDTEPQLSVAGRAGQPGMVVLRSFGKFFGLAGLRLGFALCSAQLAPTLRDALGPWAVSGPALHIGAKALGDFKWQASARARLDTKRDRLDGLIEGAGFKVLGGTALFRLVETDGLALHRHLARSGIWTRAFEWSPDRLRFGLPGDDAGWSRLAKALGEFKRD
jgi:cobalamin biosynthetic protein CobC